MNPQVTLFFIILFCVNSALAAGDEISKVDDFCKELTPQIAKGSITEGTIKSIAAHNFGEEILKDSKKIEQYKTIISQINTDENARDDLFNLCRSLFVKEFTNLAQRVLGIGKVNDEAGLTTEEHKDKSDDTKGFEELPPHVNFITVQEEPIEALCRMNEISGCESFEPGLSNDLISIVQYHTVNPEPFSELDCECFDKKTNLNKVETIAKAQSTWDEIDHIIIKETGTKFINDYAKFYEDLRSFEVNRAWALKENGKGEKDPIDANILCVDPQLFMKSIAAKCAENGTTNEQEARTSELLSSLGGHFNGSQKEFPNSFKNLVKDIEINPVSLGNKGESRVLEVSRRDFEKSRVHNARVMPDVTVVDELIGIVFKDKDLKAKLEAAMNGSQPTSPLEAMKRMFSTKGLEASTIKKVLGKINNPKKNDVVLKKLLDNLGKDSFDVASADMFRAAVAYHPGLKNILLDKNLFNEVTASVEKNDRGVLAKAERSKVFSSFFYDRCNGLKEQLAQAVCTKTADLKNKVDKNEMLPLLSKSTQLNRSNPDSQNVLNFALCAMKGAKSTSPSAFTGLAAKGPFASSDYKRRKAPPFGPVQKDMFSAFAERIATDKSFQESQRKIAQEESYLNSSSSQIDDEMKFFPSALTSTNVKALSFSPNKTSGTLPKVPSPLPTGDKIINSVNQNQSSSAEADFAEQSSGQLASPASFANTPASSSVTLPQAVAKTPESKDFVKKDEEVTPLKEELKSSFSKSDQKKMEGFLSNVNDEDAKELLRLREQSKKDKADISDMKLEQEKNKTLELQAKYEELSKKLENLTKSKSTPDNQSTTFSSHDSGIDHKAQGIANISEKTNFTDFQGTSGSASGSPAQVNGPQALGATMKGPSLGSNATSNQGLESKSQATLMISSQKPQGQNKAEDPSQELIAFLSKNEPDFKTLYELKDSGIIFNYVDHENGIPVPKSKVIKYSDLSEDAKKLVDHKISKLDAKEAAKLKEQILISKRAYSIQALKLELLSSGRSLNK